MFGYGLLVVPVILYLWYWLMPRNPKLITLFTLFGLGGLFASMIASAIFYGTLPQLISAYQQASDTERAAMEVVFTSQVDVGFIGILNIYNFTTGIWLIGIGSLLRAERRLLGISALVIGIGTFAFGMSDSLQLDFEPLEVLELFTFLIPLWFLWLGIVILQDTGPGTVSESS